MVAVVMRPVVVPTASATTVHNDTTGLTELRPLGLHAGRDLGNVGNEIAAQPHRIGRASLAGGVIGLSRSALRLIKEAAGE